MPRSHPSGPADCAGRAGFLMAPSDMLTKFRLIQGKVTVDRYYVHRQSEAAGGAMTTNIRERGGTRGRESRKAAHAAAGGYGQRHGRGNDVTPAICLTFRPVGIVPGSSAVMLAQDGGPHK
jgi:hypothetical protein